MRKFILPLLALLLFSTGVTAQTVNLRAKKHANVLTDVKKSSLKTNFKAAKDVVPSQWLTTKELQKLQSPKLNRSRAITRAEESNYTWWTYPTSQNLYGIVNSDIIETSTSNDYNLAILVPSSLGGVKVDSVLFCLNDPTKVKNLKVWFAAAQYDSNGSLLPPPTSSTEYDYSFDVDIPAGGLTSVYNMFKLPEVYTIPSNGCIVGYSFTTTSTAKQALFYYDSANSIGVDGGFFMNIDGVWYDIYQYISANLTTALHIDIADVAQNSVSAYGIVEGTGKIGEAFEMTAMVYNNSPLAIDSISYIVSQNGKASEEQTYTFDGMLSGNEYAYVSFDMAPEKEGENSVSIEITKVNGVANTAEDNKVDNGVLIGLAETAERTSVVEQFTGTWCGYCPRGHVGLANLKKKYGDKIVTLAAHIGNDQYYPDAMATDDFHYVQYYVTGTTGAAPDAIFDRIVNGDPYYGLSGLDADGVCRFHSDIVVDVIKQNFPSEGSVKLEAGWTDESHSSLTARVGSTFTYNRDKYPYGLVFVLTEDGMFGSGTGWTQYNYYSSAYGLTHEFHDSDMDEYNNGSYLIENEEYNNVIIGSWFNTDIEKGAYGALYGITTPYASLSNAKNQSNSWLTSLPFNSKTKSLIQDDTQLSLAVLLVNNNNGQVVNAAQVKITDEIFNGINSVTTSDTTKVASRYNVNGQRMTAPVKGLNIVKMANGQVKKVMVK